MDQKKLIFGTFVGIIVLCGVLTTCFLLSSTEIATQTPVSAPVNIVDLSDQNFDSPQFAVITDEDTLELRNSQNKIIPVKIGKQNWKDIKWAPDGKNFAVKGENAQNFDLYLFDLSSENIVAITEFETFENGVESWAWSDSENIIFVQDGWLHRYNLNSGETKKLSKNDSEIFDHSQTHLLFKNSEQKFLLTDLDGNTVYPLDMLELKKEGEEAQKINIQDAIFTKDPKKIVLIDADGKAYKHEIGNDSLVEVSMQKDLNLVCAINSDVLSGIMLDESTKTISVTNINIKEEKSFLIGQKILQDIESIDLAETSCFDESSLLIKTIDKNSESQWYTLSSGRIEKSPNLKGAIEANHK